MRRPSRPAAAMPGTWAVTYAYMAIMAALVYRTVSGRGQYIDASIHEACALTTEAAIANYIYRGEVVRRQTGRHHAPGPTPRTQFRAKDGKYVMRAGRRVGSTPDTSKSWRTCWTATAWPAISKTPNTRTRR